MRYPEFEKLEIIRLVEGSHLPIRRTLDKLGIPRTTFYRWYDRYLAGGPEALEDRSPRPSRVWNRIPEVVREKIKDLALKESDLSPRELAGAARSMPCPAPHIRHSDIAPAIYRQCEPKSRKPPL